jgi:hypothetical protein
MPNISELEARALLERPLRCSDCGSWCSSGKHPGKYWIKAGLADEFGQATGLTVELRCRLAPKGKTKHFVFTVFRRKPYWTDRIYQLEANQARKSLKDRHEVSHEHVGDARILGPDSWNTWKFEQILLYFCGQTNIDFEPRPSAPEQF